MVKSPSYHGLILARSKWEVALERRDMQGEGQASQPQPHSRIGQLRVLMPLPDARIGDVHVRALLRNRAAEVGLLFLVEGIKEVP